ncbi:MAG: NTP transferase domain-containing protein [Candidatus Liptonbacteria bacterium]|nr:NTP transferase domain-containing protein [Candidatus Liptonbacteria bacterium]
MVQKITKLVLPVAGLGKRLHPLTLRKPKALVEVGDRPMLDYILSEATGTSIREVVLVVNPHQGKQFEQYLVGARKRFPHLNFHVRFQKFLLGTGHVLLSAKDLIQREPFVLRFCDDILLSPKSILETIIHLYTKLKSPILTLRRIPKAQVSRFGVVAIRKIEKLKEMYRISGVVEKPPVSEAPSNLVLIGAYVLTPTILRRAQELEKKLEGIKRLDTLPITDIFELEIKRGGKIYGWEFKGKYLDCGTLESLKRADDFIRLRRKP